MRKEEKSKENQSNLASTNASTEDRIGLQASSSGNYTEFLLTNHNILNKEIVELKKEIDELKKNNNKLEEKVKRNSEDKSSIAFYDAVLVVIALFFTSFVGMLSSVGSVSSLTGWNDVKGNEFKRALQRLAFSCVTVLWSLTIMLGRRLNLSTNIERKDQDQNDDFRDYIHKILTLISRFSLVVGVCLFGHALVILQLNVAGWTFIGVALFSFFHRLLDLYLISGKFFQSLIVFIELEPEKNTSN